MATTDTISKSNTTVWSITDWSTYRPLSKRFRGFNPAQINLDSMGGFSGVLPRFHNTVFRCREVNSSYQSKPKPVPWHGHWLSVRGRMNGIWVMLWSWSQQSLCGAGLKCLEVFTETKALLLDVSSINETKYTADLTLEGFMGENNVYAHKNQGGQNHSSSVLWLKF